jgi:hypothetical protein
MFKVFLAHILPHWQYMSWKEGILVLDDFIKSRFPSSLSALQNVTALRTLGLRLTQVSNLDGLENLVDLGNLNLEANDLLSDISAINSAVYKTTRRRRRLELMATHC